MKIKLPGHRARLDKLLPVWKKIAEEVNSGVAVVEVAKKYKNPKTGKNYDPASIYYIVHRLEKLKV